jgi:hypothetical protein
MPGPDHPIVLYDRIGTTLCDHVDGFAELDQARNGAYGHAVVHRNDDGFARVPVQDPLQSDLLPDFHDKDPSLFV